MRTTVYPEFIGSGPLRTFSSCQLTANIRLKKNYKTCTGCAGYEICYLAGSGECRCGLTFALRVKVGYAPVTHQDILFYLAIKQNVLHVYR